MTRFTDFLFDSNIPLTFLPFPLTSIKLYFWSLHLPLSLSPPLSVDTDNAYNLALQFLPIVSCVVKRVQLWDWLYLQVNGCNYCAG